MPASQQHITASTPMGATLVPGGATFRVWAPGADRVYVAIGGVNGYQPRSDDELAKDHVNGHFTGFIPGVSDGTKYRYLVVRQNQSQLKRDPWAREIEMFDYPNCDCIARDVNSYPWHDNDWRPPAFNDLIVYQFHIGVFYARDSHGGDVRAGRAAKFLDVLDRIEYLADLGVNAIQPLPVVEFPGEWGLGYKGTDLFSPEMDYCVAPGDIGPYLQKVNRLLAQKGKSGLSAGQLEPQVNQLKTLIDICHLYGLAFIVDVVYNHAGGDFDAQSIDFFDLSPENVYFSHDWGGGRIFDFGRSQVREFLISNAKMFLDEYHADGFRYDEIGIIDDYGGWLFVQDLASTVRYHDPSAVQIAEYWRDHRWLAVWRPPAGMGFDLGYSEALRDGVRACIGEAAGGSTADVRLGRLKGALERRYNYPTAWQMYNCVENHDLIVDMDGDHRKPRVAKLAHWHDPRSWHARSRARVATGLLLTAPGVPMIFMGQEFLEDKLWSDNFHRPELFIWWEGQQGADPHMVNFHRFTRELAWLRRRHPALRGEGANVYHINELDRILALHRWLPGEGRDVIVVASLREETFYGSNYQIGVPQPGHWHEVFNSDAYDGTQGWIAGNPGGVFAEGPPRDGMPCSAGVTIPANSIIVFARDWGS